MERGDMGLSGWRPDTRLSVGQKVLELLRPEGRGAALLSRIVTLESIRYNRFLLNKTAAPMAKTLLCHRNGFGANAEADRRSASPGV